MTLIRAPDSEGYRMFAGGQCADCGAVDGQEMASTINRGKMNHAPPGETNNRRSIIS